jgi:hypothetical protein
LWISRVCGADRGRMRVLAETTYNIHYVNLLAVSVDIRPAAAISASGPHARPFWNRLLVRQGPRSSSKPFPGVRRFVPTRAGVRIKRAVWL